MRLDAPMVAPNGVTVSSGAGSGITSPYGMTDGRLQPAGSIPPGYAQQQIPTAAAVLPPAGGGASQFAKPDAEIEAWRAGQSGGGGGSHAPIVPSLLCTK